MNEQQAAEIIEILKAMLALMFIGCVVLSSAALVCLRFLWRKR